MFPLSKSPSFSIIVPTYNRPEQLRRCLASLLQIDFPFDRFEIIVVDDGSTSELEDACAEIRERSNFQLIRKQNGGPASARNAGAESAKGDYLAFTDDDCHPAHDWLLQLDKQLKQFPDAMIGGRVINALCNNFYAVTSQVILDAVYAFFNSNKQDARFFASNNIALSRHQFHKMGGFDTNFPIAAAEDRELCDRWILHGWHLIYEPEAIVHHAHNLTLSGFWKQHLNYGRGAYRYHRIRAQRESGRMSDDIKFHYKLPSLLKGPMRSMSWWNRGRVLMLLGVWQVANAIGFAKERLQNPS